MRIDLSEPSGSISIQGWEGGGKTDHNYESTKLDRTFNYNQIHCKTDQGCKTFTNPEIGYIARESPG